MLSNFKLLKKSKLNDKCIILSDEQLQKLHNKLMDIAKDIFDLCQENDINIMLAYGSALGAIRHKSIIPWDDDLDLLIKREDYEKFLKLFKNKYEEKYWIHTPNETKNYGSLITKIISKDTVARKPEDFATNECGVFVDIMSLDNMYNNIFLRKIHSFMCYILAGIVSCRRTVTEKKHLLSVLDDEKAKKSVINKARVGRLFCFLSLDSWVHITDRLFRLCKNNKSKYLSDFIVHKRMFGDNYPREYFSKVRTCDFGKEKWNVPYKAEEYLKYFYGDYMKIPKDADKEKHIYIDFKI